MIHRNSIYHVPPIQDLLWNNVGFARLRDIPEIYQVEQFYSPIVIRSSPGQLTDARTHMENVEARRPASSVYPSALDYHRAYLSGKVTPSAIVEYLLPLIHRDGMALEGIHSVGFSQSNADLARRAAEESTKRYKLGQPLGLLDGVPVSIKDDTDLSGYRTSYSSKNDHTRKDDATSWSARQWIEAGAIVIGKTVMSDVPFSFDLKVN